MTSNFRGSNYGCVFGCHVLENGQPNPSPSQTNETLAHANGISLRIDVIKSAISNMIAQAVSSEGQAGGPSVSIGLYTLEQNLTTLTTPVDATTNFTTLNNYTLSTTVNPQAIDLGSQTNGGGLADSYPAAVLSSLASSLSTNGKGDSPTAPSNYVFIMTDGTSDTTWSNAVASTCPNSYYNNSHCLSPYDATFTSAFSGKATVGIIYTTYLPLYNGNDPTKGYQGDYNNLIIPISSQIGPGLLAAADVQRLVHRSLGSDIDQYGACEPFRESGLGGAVDAMRRSGAAKASQGSHMHGRILRPLTKTVAAQLYRVVRDGSRERNVVPRRSSSGCSRCHSWPRSSPSSKSPMSISPVNRFSGP